MKGSSKKRAVSKKLSADIARKFDAEGVCRAVLAALICVYRRSPYVTLPQLLIALEVVLSERDRNPHTLVSLARKLDMPVSTASRVVWTLTKEGGDHGLVEYEEHPSDRRKKYLVTGAGDLNRDVAHALVKAMIEYYGESVNGLHRA